MLLKIFETMIKYSGTGKNGDWTRSDIENLLKGNEWILYNEKTGWFKNPDFEDFLKLFNQRRKIFKTSDGLEKLITENSYDILSQRFYKIVKRDEFRSMLLFISNPPNRCFSDLLVIDFYFSKNPDLIDYFIYKPHVFIYWFGD